MKGWFLFFIVLASSAFLIPSISMASDYDYGPNLFSNTAIDGVMENRADSQGYASNAQVCGAYLNGDCLNIHAGFWEGLSYTGQCDWLPKGAVCLTYSDNYNWVVSDYRIDCVPIFAGVCNCKPIELIRCYGANYYHILGTSLIMSIPRPESTFIRPAQ
jgi:hypothetical protein